MQNSKPKISQKEATNVSKADEREEKIEKFPKKSFETCSIMRNFVKYAS
jgi:hypothetical protein